MGINGQKGCFANVVHVFYWCSSFGRCMLISYKSTDEYQWSRGSNFICCQLWKTDWLLGQLHKQEPSSVTVRLNIAYPKERCKMNEEWMEIGNLRWECETCSTFVTSMRLKQRLQSLQLNFAALSVIMNLWFVLTWFLTMLHYQVYRVVSYFQHHPKLLALSN